MCAAWRTTWSRTSGRAGSGRITSRGCRRGGGCCSTTWISWYTCSTRSSGRFISSNGFGATPPWSPSATRDHKDGRDDADPPSVVAGGGAAARRRGFPPGAVLRPEQGPVPHLRLQGHPDRALRGVLLRARARGGARRGAHGRARLCAAVAGAAPRVPGSQGDHPVRVALRFPADQRDLGRHRRGHGRGRSEEHTSELQSLAYLVCRLLLEKKKY